MKIELSKSYKVAGHEVKEIELDLESLTGTELLACEKEFKLKNKDSFFKEGEDGYALVVASKATSVLSKNKINISYDSLMNETLESLAYYWVPLIEDIKMEEEKHKDD